MSANPQPSDCAMEIMAENPELTVEEAQGICNLMAEVSGDLGTVLSSSQKRTFIAKKIKDLKAKKHAIDLNKKRKTILALKKLRSFEWSLPMDMHAEDYMLVKGVAATEGEFKSLDTFSRDNLNRGAGALSMAAALGMSTLNIDHYGSEPLPAKYAEKYRGIGDIGDCGFVLDADIADNMVNGKRISQVEFVGYVTNKTVYNLIGEGKIKGMSVEDMQRRADCDCGDKPDANCGCHIEGSRFVNIGLILEEIPDSHGTWISHVTEDDLKMWRENRKNNQKDVIPFHKMDAKHKAHYFNLTKHARKTSRNLDDYMDERGAFINGKTGIMEYLQEEKELSDIDAKHLSEFLYSNPKILSAYQLQGMSGMDLMEWFKHVVIQRAIRKHKAYEAPNEDGTCREGFELSEDGSTCIEIETRAEVLEDGSCPDGWHLSEDGTQCIEDEVSETETNDSAQDEIETMDPNEDGTCPDGWELSEDGAKCLRSKLVENEGEVEETPTPDDNGNCPNGWHASDDGLTCIKDEPSIIDTENSMARHSFKKKTPSVIINEGSQVKNHAINGVEIVESEFQISDYATELPQLRNPVIYGNQVPSNLAEKWRLMAIHALESVEYLQKKTE